MGGSETFKDKQDFFYHEVRKYHQKHYHEKMSMKVNRDKLLESSMKATKNFSVSDWCRNFEITFQGEQGNLRFRTSIIYWQLLELGNNTHYYTNWIYFN